MDNTGWENTTISTDRHAVVCMIGTLRALDITRKNLVQKVIQPLNADLMFCVTRMGAEDEILLDGFENCNIVDVCIYEDGKDGYEYLCDEFSKNLNPANPSRWREYFKIEGNWLGGMQGRNGSGMHLTFNYWKLLKRIQYLREKGFKYQRFVITRTDFFWMVDHPPLNLLDPRFIWIPTGEDYGGYNDRHAVCSQGNISDYLNMFELMMNLKALNYISHEYGNNLNHEKFLKLHLDYCRVEVCRFKNIAYLTGNPNTLTNWLPVNSTSIDGKEYAYKYKKELLTCLKNVKKFEKHKKYKKMINVSPIELLMEKYKLWLKRLLKRLGLDHFIKNVIDWMEQDIA